MSTSFRARFFFGAKEVGPGGAGILLAESWADKVIEVQCISHKTLLLKLIIGKAGFTFLFVYAPQANLPEPYKGRFHDPLQYAVAKVQDIEIFIPVGDWNSHISSAAAVSSDAKGMALVPVMT